jgi:FdhE protein
MTDTRKLLSPEEIAVRAGEQIEFLRLPEAGLFAERALRLRELAAGHAMGDYLRFLAELAEAQHRALKREQALDLPTEAEIEVAANAGQALLPAENGPRDARWRDDARALWRELLPHLPAGAARDVAERLVGAADEHLQAQALRLLTGVMHGLDFGEAPLVAAALQLHWHRLIQQIQARSRDARLAPFGRTDALNRCPCCASRPLAGFLRLGAETAGTRYLVCGLCGVQWHYVRVRCTHCEGGKGLSLQSLVLEGETAAPQAAAIEAECCSECGHYLKLMHQARDNGIEPVADDLASLTLDLLVADSGLERVGANLLLLFGDPELPPPEGRS